MSGVPPPTFVAQYSRTARTPLPHLSPPSLSVPRDVETAQIKKPSSLSAIQGADLPIDLDASGDFFIFPLLAWAWRGPGRKFRGQRSAS